MKFFIGLTFAQNQFQFKKIDSFRKRFDNKYTKGHCLQMTLLPPFELPAMSGKAFQDLVEELDETLDGHLLGLEEVKHINFNALDFKNSKKKILYLKPDLPVDLFHCQEVLFHILKKGGAVFKGKKAERMGTEMLQTFLPLGRFHNELLLESAIEGARGEFQLPIKLEARDVSLFENLPGWWFQKRKIFTFSPTQDNLLQDPSIDLRDWDRAL